MRRMKDRVLFLQSLCHWIVLYMSQKIFDLYSLNGRNGSYRRRHSVPSRKRRTDGGSFKQEKILIIEDDTDIREFLKKEISVYFEVVAEADGVAGFERARTYDADLIICDVLMPGMNGYEVTRKLKNEFSTSHIPIILLTAMGTTENKLKE